LGRVVVGKVILNHTTPPKLVETIINSGLEPVILNGRVDVAFTVEAMRLISNPKVGALALVVRDAHFLPIFLKLRELVRK